MPGLAPTELRPVERSPDHVHGKAALEHPGNREARAVDRDALAQLQIMPWRINLKVSPARRVATFPNGADRGDDPGEHDSALQFDQHVTALARIAHDGHRARAPPRNIGQALRTESGP